MLCKRHPLICSFDSKPFLSGINKTTRCSMFLTAREQQQPGESKRSSNSSRERGWSLQKSSACAWSSLAGLSPRSLRDGPALTPGWTRSVPGEPQPSPPGRAPHGSAAQPSPRGSPALREHRGNPGGHRAPSPPAALSFPRAAALLKNSLFIFFFFFFTPF